MLNTFGEVGGMCMHVKRVRVGTPSYHKFKFKVNFQFAIKLSIKFTVILNIFFFNYKTETGFKFLPILLYMF